LVFSNIDAEVSPEWRKGLTFLLRGRKTRRKEEVRDSETSFEF